MYNFLKVIKKFVFIVLVCIYVFLLAVGPFELLIKHTKRRKL